MTIELGLMLAGMLMIGFLAQWLAWRVKLPAILFLLLAGIPVYVGMKWWQSHQAERDHAELAAPPPPPVPSEAHPVVTAMNR